MKLKWIAAAMVFAAGWGSCAFGQGAEAENVLAKEPKLAQKVRLKVEGMSVNELLKRLSTKTGVSLSAQREAGTDKVIIFSPLRPLKETLEDVAELFGDVWTANTQKTGDLERTSYTLVRTTRAREKERELREQYTRNLLSSLDRVTHPSGGRGNGKESVTMLLGTLFDGLNSQQRETLVKEGIVSLPLARLSAAQWRALTEARPGLLALANGGKEQAPPRPTPMANLGAGVRRLPGNRRSAPSPSAPMPEPDKPTQPIISEADRQMYDGGLLFSLPPLLPQSSRMLRCDWLGLMAGASVAVPLVAPRGNPYGEKSLFPEEKLPTLEQIFAAEKGELLTRLAVFARETGRPVLCDYYRTQNVSPALPGGGGSIPQIPMTEMGLAFSYGETKRAWWLKGDTFLFRQRDWFFQSQYEISDEWLDGITKQIASHGGNPTLGDLARLRELTQEQKFALETKLMPLDEGTRYGLNDLTLRKAAYDTADAFSDLHFRDLNPRTLMPSENGKEYERVLEIKQSSPQLQEALKSRLSLVYPLAWVQKGVETRLMSKNSSSPLFFPFEIKYGSEGDPFTSFSLNLPLGVPDDRRDKVEISGE